MKFWKGLAIGVGILTVGATAAFAYYRQSVDEPDFKLLAKDGDFQLREYGPMIVAEVTHAGDRRRSLNAGFRRLAAYIFAEDRPGAKIAMTAPVTQAQQEKIAMTAPVLQDGGEGTGGWRTRFVMPADYTMETLPQPPSDITLTEVPRRRIAAIGFSGSATSKDLAEKEQALRDWMAARKLVAAGPAEYAFYDAPMVPPQVRRNEVMIPVA